MNKLSPNALGLAIGVLWASYVLFCGITAMFGWGVALVDALASLYIGYDASILGAVIGAVVDKALYLIIYTGAAIYYFPKYSPDFEEVVSSIEIRKTSR